MPALRRGGGTRQVEPYPGVRHGDKGRFSSSFEVRIGVINHDVRMGNDGYLLLFHDARIRYLEALAWAEGGTGKDISGLIMRKESLSFERKTE